MLLGVSKTPQARLRASIPNSAGDLVSIVALQHADREKLPSNRWGVEENAFLRNRGPVATAAGTYVPPPAAYRRSASPASSTTSSWDLCGVRDSRRSANGRHPHRHIAGIHGTFTEAVQR